MAKKWDEKLYALSADLEDLSKKTAAAAEDAKAARELREEKISDRISTTKGNVAALQENIRIAEEENRSKLASAILKARMSVRARIEDCREAKDKALFEVFIGDRMDYVFDCYNSAALLVADAQLTILEIMDAIAEYDARYGTKEEEPEEAPAAE